MMAADAAFSYLGASAGPAARTADAVVVLRDGELPVHSARLCFGVLEEAVALALDCKQPQKPLCISIPTHCKADFVLFLRLVYSLRPEELARGMDLADLLTAGLVAHLCGFVDTLAVIEGGVLGKFCTLDGDFIKYAAAAKNTQQLLDFAETVKSENIAAACGVSIALCFRQPDVPFALRAAFQACKQKCKDQAVRLG